MTELEMEGFLRGKCVPGDMLVNESNAQYLVRKFKALEAQRDALAAEVYDVKHPGTYLPSKCETPATDDFLREVRAQGVESGIKTIFTMMNHQAPAVKDAINVLEKHAVALRQGGAA